MQQIIDYINKKLEKYSKVVSDMDKKYIGNEIKYTYHGGFDHGYAKGKLTALEDMKDKLQSLPENNSQAIDIAENMLSKYTDNISGDNFQYDCGYCNALEQILVSFKALGDGSK